MLSPFLTFVSTSLSSNIQPNFVSVSFAFVESISSTLGNLRVELDILGFKVVGDSAAGMVLVEESSN